MNLDNIRDQSKIIVVNEVVCQKAMPESYGLAIQGLKRSPMVTSLSPFKLSAIGEATALRSIASDAGNDALTYK